MVNVQESMDKIQREEDVFVNIYLDDEIRLESWIKEPTIKLLLSI